MNLLRPNKLGDLPPKRHRYCRPCSTQWLSHETACWLCGSEGEEGVLKVTEGHGGDPYHGPNTGLEKAAIKDGVA